MRVREIRGDTAGETITISCHFVSLSAGRQLAAAETRGYAVDLIEPRDAIRRNIRML